MRTIRKVLRIVRDIEMFNKIIESVRMLQLKRPSKSWLEVLR
jgi:hypothetical protein